MAPLGLEACEATRTSFVYYLSQGCRTRWYGLRRWRCVEKSLHHLNTLKTCIEFFVRVTGLQLGCRLQLNYHFLLSFMFPHLSNILQQ